MDLSAIEKSISELSGNAYPLEKWHPELCHPMDMVIDVNGKWLHNGGVIKREKLVILFAKILIKQAQDYFLITPVEKLQITVEDAPFIIVDFEVEALNTPQQVIWLISNIGDRVALSNDYPMILKGAEQRPYINLWRGLDALVSRSVYYQLVDLATEVTVSAGNQLVLRSSDADFSLGNF
jgi:hypothetical protein